MATYRQEGRIIDYTPGADVSAGEVVVLGTPGIVGVANQDIPANRKGALSVRGVFEFPKGATAFAAGDRVKWSGTAIVAATAGATHGVVVVDAAVGAGTVMVDISPAYAAVTA